MERARTEVDALGCLRWVITIGLVSFALLRVNAALFHWWSSWGPPNSDPAVEVALARRFAREALGTFGLAAIAFWQTRARNR